MPPLSKKQFQSLLFFFVLVISINYLVILTNYAFHFEAITKNLGQGKAMPFLKEHITFSIMAAFAFFIGIELSQDASFLEKKWAKNTLWGLTIFLFIAIHIIAVRTRHYCSVYRFNTAGGDFCFSNSTLSCRLTGFCAFVCDTVVVVSVFTKFSTTRELCDLGF